MVCIDYMDAISVSLWILILYYAAVVTGRIIGLARPSVCPSVSPVRAPNLKTPK